MSWAEPLPETAILIFILIKLLFENRQAMLEQLAPKSRLEELEDEVAVLRAAVRQHSTEIAKLKQA